MTSNAGFHPVKFLFRFPPFFVVSASSSFSEFVLLDQRVPLATQAAKEARFAANESKVQAIARRRADAQLMRVPWSNFRKAYEEYPRWHALTLWTNLIVASQGGVRSWLVEVLRKRCGVQVASASHAGTCRPPPGRVDPRPEVRTCQAARVARCADFLRSPAPAFGLCVDLLGTMLPGLDQLQTPSTSLLRRLVVRRAESKVVRQTRLSRTQRHGSEISQLGSHRVVGSATIGFPYQYSAACALRIEASVPRHHRRWEFR